MIFIIKVFDKMIPKVTFELGFDITSNDRLRSMIGRAFQRLGSLWKYECLDMLFRCCVCLSLLLVPDLVNVGTELNDT